jgi:toxin ParE1/3/4
MPSSRRVRLTDEAVTDYAAILQYTLENWGADQLDRYQVALDDALNALAMFPMMGRQRESLAAGLRAQPVGQHVVYYTIVDDEILVRRILHGRANAREDLKS